MKNIKFNSIITFLVIATSLITLSCSMDEEKAQENSITKDKTANELRSPACEIIGNSTVSSGTYSYTYTNFGNNSIVNWTITQNGNPVPSTVVGVVTGQNSTTVTINFSNSSDGIYRISAFGTGGSDGACEGILYVTKSTEKECDCSPLLSNIMYDYQEGVTNVENFYYFSDRSICNFNWANVDSVVFRKGFGTGTSIFNGIELYGGSNLIYAPTLNISNVGNWSMTSSPYNNIKIYKHLNNSDIPPLFKKTKDISNLGAHAIIKFKNNSCPDIYLTLDDDSDLWGTWNSNMLP